ncbi:unnamed protein product [Owenia fusiformis]|uniref:Carboxypeptidase Q n=1 Tax=Owenia fusiformis TaxID=6347 RepID=A0A8J1XVA5_OWEFU|nr:unnamed protein product [Owenia fusiformis]
MELFNIHVLLTLGYSIVLVHSSPVLQEDITKYKDAANRIIHHLLDGPAQNQSYNRLATFTDKFGSRIAGSEYLEHAIDYMLDTLSKEGLDNVHGENVMVPQWVRGKESATLLSPRNHKMAMLGLGSSIATPPAGITADVLVVSTFKELKQRAAEAKGKIIVYNEKFVSYGETVAYRQQGATEAAKVGAVASLIRSVTPFSINSPHTGWQDYTPGVKKIPTACITVEDAEMLHRMQKRGEKLTIRLKMNAKNNPYVKSRNTVAEITGSVYPEQVVIVSGHLDSWDVGQGAMDDGGGAFISWQVLSVIKQLNLRPKRTVRLVMWTGEEEGGFGGQAYFNAHKKNISNFNLVMESDMGVFTPYGINFKGNTAATTIMQQILNLLGSINSTTLEKVTAVGTDIGSWAKAGVPGVSLLNRNEKYFYFHHSNGDTMTVMDPKQMNLCAAVWTVVAYVVADLDSMLPRDIQPPYNEAEIQQDKRFKNSDEISRTVDEILKFVIGT